MYNTLPQDLAIDKPEIVLRGYMAWSCKVK